MTEQIEGLIGWRACRSESGEVWVGSCDALGLTVEGQTLDELHNAIPAALSDLLADLVADGDLDEFLQSKGWSGVEIPHVRAFAEGTSGPLPWEMITAGELDDSHRRAA